jgi:hypothetical protein
MCMTKIQDQARFANGVALTGSARAVPTVIISTVLGRGTK